MCPKLLTVAPAFADRLGCADDWHSGFSAAKKCAVKYKAMRSSFTAHLFAGSWRMCPKLLTVAPAFAGGFLNEGAQLWMVGDLGKLGGVVEFRSRFGAFALDRAQRPAGDAWNGCVHLLPHIFLPVHHFNRFFGVRQ